jgi:hypothetical protein
MGSDLWYSILMVKETESAAIAGRPAKAGLGKYASRSKPWYSILTKEAAMVKQGDNVKFICTYLFNHPGAGPAQVRRALCEARGIDATVRRGYYAAYVYTRRFKHHWTHRDGGFYLTQRGLAQVQA